MDEYRDEYSRVDGRVDGLIEEKFMEEEKVQIRP